MQMIYVDIFKSTLSGSHQQGMLYYWENGSFIVPQNGFYLGGFSVVVGYGGVLRSF